MSSDEDGGHVQAETSITDEMLVMTSDGTKDMAERIEKTRESARAARISERDEDGRSIRQAVISECATSRCWSH